MRLATASALLLLVGCSPRPSDGAATGPGAPDDPSARPVDASLFVGAALVGEVTEEPCILSGGTEATCVRFSVNTTPVDHAAGPWCPATITGTAEAGGVWPEGAALYDVDGPFVPPTRS